MGAGTLSETTTIVESLQHNETNSAANWYLAAERHYRAHNITAAVGEMMKCVNIDPTYPNAKERLTYWTEELEDVTGEVVRLRELISSNADNTEAHFQLARKLQILGDVTCACKEWELVTALDNGSWAKSAHKMLRKFICTTSSDQ